MELFLLSLIVVLLIAVLVIQLRKPGVSTSSSQGTSPEEIVAKLEQIRAMHDQHAAVLSKELDLTRQEAATHARDGRTEIVTMLNQGNASLLNGLTLLGQTQNDRLQSFSETITALTSANDTKFESIRATMETKLKELRDDNALRLEEMRRTVDEKLQGTLEKRLGESFKQVSDRLEQVHRGLGEMQNLAIGVGDLKKVLTNVKTRGGWGEVQLGALLEQMLTPAQYEKNVKTNPSSGEIVEYAIKLPGKGEDDSVVWLPVDAKFFIEDFKRLHEAQERADLVAIEESTKALRDAVLKCAKDISSKYLNPPHTTDFGVMFVPTEGLFAEIIRIPGVIEDLQGKHRVVLAGPTTFAALLNSLQMGFKTLTIQKQSSEVWKTLSDVKAEFAKFGDSLDAVKKKLLEASNKIESVGTRSRAIERSLRNVESLPGQPTAPALDIDDLLKIEESESDAREERE
ncbi:MAG: DNA recombination protein RmuC [Verrucomicrobia bacterium]|nr:DNA recombination protein RmuC [Verrucomicrobiota bacterium]